MALTEGQMVGQYKIVSQLGFGGMATVYKAYHARLDRHVAIKMMHPAFQEDQTFLTRFEREAQIVGRLAHPHIVPIYDFDEYESQPYLVMRLIEGRTLKQMLYQAPPSLETLLILMTALADALDYAHREGVLHRDIKPSNIIIANDGTPFLTDFGLARMAQISDSTLSHDVMLGTPHYISPEQALGARDLTPSTDLYSLAVVLYELTVGRVPYVSDTPFAVIHSHIYSPLPKPSAINPEITELVEAVLIKALAKKPDDRYPTATIMIAAFRTAVSQSGVTTLDPNRIRVASERIDNIPPAYEMPTPITIESVSPPFAGAAVYATHDPEMTSAPTPLPRRPNNAPQQPTVPPMSTMPVNIGEKIGEWGNRIGEWGARMGEFGDQLGEKLDQWGESFDAGVGGRGKSGGQVMATKDDAQIVRLPGGGVIVRTPRGVEAKYDRSEAQEAPWWDKVKEGDWGEALNAIMSENDEIAAPDDQEANRRRAKKQIKEQQGFVSHLLPFVVVNIVLQFSAVGDDFNWAMMVLFAWGAGLAAHGVNTYFTTGMREARRIASIQRAYRDELGVNWATAPKAQLKKIRRLADRPFRKRREFLTHFVIYLSINALSWSIYAMSGEGDFPWPILPGLFWGIGVAAQFFDMFSRTTTDAAVERILARERATIEGSVKRKNEDTSVVQSSKRKNDVRLTEDGELTDSVIREMETEARREKRR